MTKINLCLAWGCKAVTYGVFLVCEFVFWELGPGSSVWEKGKKRGQIANRKKYRRASIFPQSLAWSQANCVRFQLLLKCRKLSYKDFNFGRNRSRFSHNAKPGPRLLGCTCLHEIEASKGEVALPYPWKQQPICIFKYELCSSDFGIRYSGLFSHQLSHHVQF